MSNLDNRGPFRPGVVPGDAGDGARVESGGDREWAEYAAWLDREAAAGREPELEGWLLDDVDPWDLDPWDPKPTNPVPAGPTPAVPGASGPAAGDLGRPLFVQDGAADVMAPSPFLAALTEQAVADVAALSDNELIGVLRASRRQVAREQYKQVLAAAEFGRRRQAAFNDALARGVPAGCAAGGFPGEELAIELVISRGEAGRLIDDAIDLTARLPNTLAGMAAGLVDAGKAGWIALYTRSLDPADTARADEVLAAEAPDLRDEQLARKAAALEMRLNPDAVKARREHARRDGQRVEARREASGNASLAGRELDTADVLASKAYLDAVAARLRESGIPGSLDRLRALALTELTQGRNPLDRIVPPSAPGRASGSSAARPPATSSGPSPDVPRAPSSGSSPADPPRIADPADEDDIPSGLSARPGCAAPVPALINLLVPAGTLLGFSAAPAQAGAWGLLDADEIRPVVTAAAAHPATRWCLTLTGPDGTALAHGCARGPRPRLLNDLEPQPPPAQLAELFRRLNVSFTAVTRGSCDHAYAEVGYVPSRKLRHLVRARTVTCDAPGCQNPAVNADLDHTVHWPDGPTDQCNLAPRCRSHHRAKQAPDWTVEQIAPGVTRWTLPSGRSHITTPTRYDT